MKRFFKHSVMVMILLSTAAGIFAGGSDEGGQQTSYRIGYIPTLMGHPVTVAWEEGLKRYLATIDIDAQLQSFDAETRAENQVTMMQELINQNYDVIILQPVDAAALSASVMDAESKGIHVITLNTDVKVNHAALVQMADIDAGYLVGEAMGKQIGGEGNVVIIQSPPGATLGVNREIGFRNAMEELYPNITIVGAQNAEWKRDLAISVMNSFLQANDEISGCFAVNDTMAAGAVIAAESADRLEEIKIWGANGQNEALVMIEQERMAGTAYNNCYEQGAMAAEIAVNLMTGNGDQYKSDGSTHIVQVPPFAATLDTIGEIAPEDRW